MTNRYDYALLEFTANLAEAEASYGEKLQTIIDTFSQSRLDLPLKRLSEIAKVHGRAAQNLRKSMDVKKNEHLNLWKMCNIYSCFAVDLDKAMRETRATLRLKMSIDGSVVEKPKRRNIFNSILTTSSNRSEVPTERKWFPKLSVYDRKPEIRASRKATTGSLEDDPKEDPVLIGSKSTPPTPPIIRPAHSVKPPRPPKHNVPEVPQIPPPSIPISAPPPQFFMEEKKYAMPIYGDLQMNNNRIVEEHLLRHQDDSMAATPSVVRIRTDVNVERELKRNEITTNVFNSNQSIKKREYVNIRPQIAQKPQILAPSKVESDVSPTFISVDCFTSTVPIPSPRTYFNSNDIPSSQRSSSSAYSSSNFSSASSSANITSFTVDSSTSPNPGSPDQVLHRF